MLGRDTVVVYAYSQAREAGEKHSVAVSETVGYVRANYPAMRISEAEVRRIVSRWRSKRSAICLFVSKPDPMQSTILVPGPDGKPLYARILYTAAVGPRPIYARANAAQRP